MKLVPHYWSILILRSAFSWYFSVLSNWWEKHVITDFETETTKHFPDLLSDQSTQYLLPWKTIVRHLKHLVTSIVVPHQRWLKQQNHLWFLFSKPLAFLDILIYFIDIHSAKGMMTLVCSSVSFPRSPARVNTQVRHDLLAKGLSVTRTELLSRAVARGAQEHLAFGGTSRQRFSGFKVGNPWEILGKRWLFPYIPYDIL